MVTGSSNLISKPTTDNCLDRSVIASLVVAIVSAVTSELKTIDKKQNEIIPYVFLWQADHHRILYWNRFGTPKYILDKFDREDVITTYWWIDPEKDRLLRNAMQNNKTLPLVGLINP